ncbi:MAG: hypothetical protein IH845_02315 [Nanoarchaeota archaeon]|nr:hypothetical protein [Nanoarchaeota archaeon]
MKKGVNLVLLLVLLSIFHLGLASAASCLPNVTLLNQDPYPAIPGEYVKLVFQIKDVSSRECKDITFELLEKYPIKFDRGVSNIKVFNKIDYIQDFSSNILVPYEFRLDENAIDGPNEIKARVQSKGDGAFIKSFNLEVEDVLVDFEAYIKEYNYKTNEITIEVLNIGGSNIEALTIEIPKQKNIQVKGSNRIVVGDLDSNEYTSADFEAIPKDGKILISLYYSDATNVRRELSKEITFDSSYFTNRIADKKSTSKTTYAFYAAAVLAIIYFFYNKRKKRLAKLKKRQI